MKFAVLACVLATAAANAELDFVNAEGQSCSLLLADGHMDNRYFIKTDGSCGFSTRTLSAEKVLIPYSLFYTQDLSAAYCKHRCWAPPCVR
jgi:hypothetical protein